MRPWLLSVGDRCWYSTSTACAPFGTSIWKAYEKGDLPAAVKGLEAILASGRGGFDVDFWLGRAQYRLSNYKAAVPAFLRPAMQFADVANQFNASVTVFKGGEEPGEVPHALEIAYPFGAPVEGHAQPPGGLRPAP